jgi:[NiFe] hydrogenase assembly HybE family chaperone
MAEGIRKPALAPPPIRPAVPRDEHPAAWLEAHYRRVLAERMQDLPFIHPDLGVEAVGFARHEGDWLGVVITPWFLNLFLISGGGSLWDDISAGQRRNVALPCGTLQFIADDDPDLGLYQYCPLIAPVTDLPDMATARQTAQDALIAVFTPPPEPAPEPPPPAATEATKPPLSRRGFLRRVAGQQ